MKNLRKSMTAAARVFREGAAEKADSSQLYSWLSDNYYLLANCAESCADACRKIEKNKKDSAELSGLYDLCRKICRNGVLPGEKELVKAFGGSLGCFAAVNLPLAVSCALVEYAREGVAAGNAELLANSVKSLRRVSETDFEEICAAASKAEKLLMADPSGIYPELDDPTKADYRKALHRKAQRKGKSEAQVAASALIKAKESSRHAGEFLFAYRGKFLYGKIVLLLSLILPLLSSFCAAVIFENALMGILMVFPFSALWRSTIDRNICKTSKAVRLMRLKTDSKLVDEVSALITVSVLMPPAEDMRKLEKHLEKIYLSNGSPKIKVCCLADFKGADSPSKPSDRTDIRAAMEAFDRLNRRYSGGFVFAVRPRVYSKTQDEFTGRERKRGAITDLIGAIKGEEKAFSIIYGDKKDLKSVKYIIALDSDTELEFDGARSLIAIAEHPLNRPIIDKTKGRVTKGYGIIVPRVENRVDYGRCTPFEKIMAGSGGVSVYDSICTEKYQALFGEGIFCGKGLIDVEAYNSLLMQGLPEERILSHDIIEGGYLKVGFASDVKITESFPRNIQSYYRRMHRWVRGDWQNVPFIFGKNPLNYVSRYKLFDNLLRSLSLPLALVSLAMSVFIGGTAGTLIAAVSVISIIKPDFCAGISAFISGGFRSVSGIFYSGAVPAALSAFSRAFISLALSVREGLTAADACAKALWRLLVSKKNLLEWSTAAMSEKSSELLGLSLSCLPSVAFFIFLFALGSPFHRLAALIILCDVPLTLLSGTQSVQAKEKISEKSREKLAEYSAAMWGFFDELCTEENNFLPPDNIQIAPAGFTAKQTSPTNIGLAMLSFLAARDFGYISSGELCRRLECMLKTVEKLEKYKGNLFNWYNVQTLEILNPAFISTVDSGNFICCLVALAEGLKEYRSECDGLQSVIERTENIIVETELGFLYNRQKKLFSIGFYPYEGKASESCYDLLMSEARLTSYFAVATRQVPKNHWQSLGRIPITQGRYCGLASWSGTMFEYFMPEIFMKSPKGSISSESLHFCLRCQRARAGKRPFGFSESGFYAFDAALNYRYKAHGVQKTGISRGLNKDFVVSPYSSFLALAIKPELSMRNLKKLENLGAYGKYGFYEAIDFTPNRVHDASGATVRSFMAHHVGMSLLAADNAMHGNCIQQRFMRSRLVRGAAGLLEEQFQPGTKVFRDIRHASVPDIRERKAVETVYSDSPDITRQRAAIYTNGRISTVLTDCGCGFITFDGIQATVRSNEAIERPEGTFAVFESEGAVIPFAAALDLNGKAEYKAHFEKEKAVYEAECEKTQLRTEVFLLRKTSCEERRFTVKNTGKETLKGRIIINVNPCLDSFANFSAHPAFSRLFLVDKKDENNNSVIVTRNLRKGERACAMLCGIKEKGEITVETSRERVLTASFGNFSLGRKTDFGSGRGNPDCCCAFAIQTELKSGEKAEYTFLTVLGETEKEVKDIFETVKAGKSENKKASALSVNDEAGDAVLKSVLPDILYPKSYYEGNETDSEAESGLADIWCFGISGDVPIVFVEIDSVENIIQIIPYIRISKVLRDCGISVDTVICHSCDEGYNSQIFQALRKLLVNENCELMLGVKGGFHAVNFRNFSTREQSALRRVACVTVRAGNIIKKPAESVFERCKIVDYKESGNLPKNRASVKQYNFTKGEISIKKEPVTVDIPWYWCIANRIFGTMVSDKAIGFTWAQNSRENKLTPWHNDVCLDNRGEILFAKYKGVFYDLAAIGNAVFTPFKAMWKGRFLFFDFCVEVILPEKGMCKKISAEIHNNSTEKEELELIYYTVPVLSESADSPSDFCASILKNGAVIKNSFASVSGYCAVMCSGEADSVCFSKPEFYSGRTDSRSSIPKNPCCAIGKRVVIKEKGAYRTDFFLSWGACADAATEIPFLCKFNNYNEVLPEIRTGINNLDLFCNSFLYSQVKNTRFFARTGPYQCSGAYGFRDQLQDCLAFLKTEPNLCRQHLLRCAAVQFEEGDVLHWWHVIPDKSVKIKGVRTLCSDDLLWMPYVLSEYIKNTSDFGILSVKIPYIIGEKLENGERERYIQPSRSKLSETLLAHCIKAAEYSMKYGENGFPLIGSCDWNDGFSEAGDTEKGESIWLAMFQIIVFEGLAELCRYEKLIKKAENLEKTAQSLRKHVEEKAWNGNFYNRAILRDGTVLGEENGFIDILPQAFAVFAGLENSEKAVIAAYNSLFDRENKVIRLLSPPFTAEKREKIGYIASYPEGIRENGGQYTHAAVWLASALLKTGRIKEGTELLNAINPLERYSDEKLAKNYRAEPYVLAGDVSYSENAVGRAGWTHFTGSAAWFYRVVSDHQADIASFVKSKESEDM